MLILASKSPRRQELIKKIYTGDLKIYPANINERAVKADSPFDLPYNIAREKGLYVSKLFPHDYVLSCDTLVFIDNQILTKPKDDQDAIRMLKLLNEKTHVVETSYFIIKDSKILSSKKIMTKLVLHNLTDKIIEAYLKTGSPFDKAGAYGIQDNNYINSTIISGTYYNVMGLPIEEIKKDFEKLNIK